MTDIKECQSFGVLSDMNWGQIYCPHCRRWKWEEQLCRDALLERRALQHLIVRG